MLSPEQVEFPVAQNELAKAFGVNKRILVNLRKQNKIPFIQAGRRILYQPSKVIAALEINPKETIPQ